MDDKPLRLYDTSLVAMIQNSVGSRTFRNFYVQLKDGSVVDAMNDGSDSCAFFVSSLLVIVKKASSMHGTIESTLEDLKTNNWQAVEPHDLQPGDVIIWEAQLFENKMQEHIGFYVGKARAVSTSMQEGCVSEHDALFDGARHITEVYRSIKQDIEEVPVRSE